MPQGRISQATYFNWKKKYAGRTPSEMKRLRQLEEEKADCRRPVLGQGHASGCAVKKTLRPGRKRELGDKV